MIVAAQPLDAKKLTEIALQSKAYRGYSAVQIESWKEELMVIPKMFQHSVIHKYLIDTEIAGFYILENTQPHSASLAFLFVAPQFLNLDLTNVLALHFPQNEHFGFWQYLTSTFMHGSFGHILFNMYGLYAFGTPLEQMWGKKKLFSATLLLK